MKQPDYAYLSMPLLSIKIQMAMIKSTFSRKFWHNFLFEENEVEIKINNSHIGIFDFIKSYYLLIR